MNCHTITETYAGKKSKIHEKISWCEIYDEEFCYGATKCKECYNSSKQIVNIPEDELRKYVIEDELSYRNIANIYNVSCHTISKRCKQYHINENNKPIEFIKSEIIPNKHKTDINDLLIEGAICNRTYFKKRLIKEGLLENE